MRTSVENLMFIFGMIPGNYLVTKSCIAYNKDTDIGTAGKELKADSDTVELIVL